MFEPEDPCVTNYEICTSYPSTPRCPPVQLMWRYRTHSSNSTVTRTYSVGGNTYTLVIVDTTITVTYDQTQIGGCDGIQWFDGAGDVNSSENQWSFVDSRYPRSRSAYPIHEYTVRSTDFDTARNRDINAQERNITNSTRYGQSNNNVDAIYRAWKNELDRAYSNRSQQVPVNNGLSVWNYLTFWENQQTIQTDNVRWEDVRIVGIKLQSRYAARGNRDFAVMNGRATDASSFNDIQYAIYADLKEKTVHAHAFWLAWDRYTGRTIWFSGQDLCWGTDKAPFQVYRSNGGSEFSNVANNSAYGDSYGQLIVDATWSGHTQTLAAVTASSNASYLKLINHYRDLFQMTF